MTVHPPLAVIPDWGPSLTFISKPGGYQYVTDHNAHRWKKGVEEEEMEKSSGLNGEKILNNHRHHDTEPDTQFGYQRQIFRRDPKSQTEFLQSRTSPYRGKYKAIWKRTGLGRRTGIGWRGRRKIAPTVQQRQSLWDSGKSLGSD